MRLFLLLALSSAVLFAADPSLLPNSKLTPGVADPRVKQSNVKNTVCRPGYTKSVRNVSAGTKREVMARYNLPASDLHLVEIDHLISLELGGANDVKNLWPEYYEPRPGAREKDQVEDYLKRQVCSGRISLADAQEAISKNWYKVYQEIHSKGSN